MTILWRGDTISDGKRSYRLAGGILAIIASCICVIVSFIGFVSTYYEIYGLIVGIVGALAFVSGLVGGILTLTRKVFPLAIIGEVFMLVGGVLTIIPGLVVAIFLVLAVPIFILALLGLIFTAAAKKDFG